MPNTGSPAGSDQAIVNACITFGMAPPFSLEDSRRRFRELAKLYHPDTGKQSDGDMFRRLGAAFQVLEANAELLSQRGLVVHRPVSPHQKLIEELRHARLENLSANDEIRQLKSETDALRAAFKSRNAANVLKYAILGVLLVGAGILGFTAGLTKGFQRPSGSFPEKTSLPFRAKFNGHKVIVKYDDTKASPTQSQDFEINGLVDLSSLRVEIHSGKAQLKDKQTSISVNIENSTVTTTLPPYS